MDPLSITASVIAIAGLSGNILTYIHDVTGASDERKRCVQEITNALGLLNLLQFRVSDANNEDPWLTEVKAMERKDSPLHQYRDALEGLCSKLAPKNSGNSSKLLSTARRRLQWPFVRGDVERLFQRVERLKSVIQFALDNDLFNLTRSIKESTTQLHDEIKAVHRSTSHIEQSTAAMLDTTHHIVSHTARMAKEEEQDETIRWLKQQATDYDSVQADINQRAQEGTGTWFLADQHFTSWETGTHETIFCPGIPGAGKTVMTSIVADHLRQNNGNVAVVYFNHKRTEEQSLIKIFFSLLLQILFRQSTIPEVIYTFYLNKKEKKKQLNPSWKDAFAMLDSLLQTCPQIFFLLDALDELSSKPIRTKLILNLCKLQSSHKGLKIMVTARFGTDIDASYPQEPCLEIRAASLDIQRYLESNMIGLSTCVQKDSSLQDLICQAILKATDGMFLLAQLHLRSLQDKTSRRQILDALKSLPAGHDALCRAYDSATNRIDSQLSGHRELARRAISWIIYSFQALTTRELQHAVAIDIHSARDPSDNVTDIDEILSCCAGLVALDKETDIVRLVHFTTEQYFTHERLGLWIENSQFNVARACLTYFSTPKVFDFAEYFNHWDHRPCFIDRDLIRLRISGFCRKWPLLTYLFIYWDEHLRPFQQRLKKSLIQFLGQNDFQSVWLFSRGSLKVDLNQAFDDHPLDWPLLDQSVSLSIAVDASLAYIVDELLQMGIHVYTGGSKFIKERSFVEPLVRAVAVSNKDILTSLLQRTDPSERTYRAALEQAQDEGTFEFMALFPPCTGTEQYNKLGRIGFSVTVGRGKPKILEGYFQRSCQRISDNEFLLSLLLKDSNRENKYMFHSILDYIRADINLKDDKGSTILCYAADMHCPMTCEILLTTPGISVDDVDKKGRTPLSYAAQRGHTHVMRTLLDKFNVCVNSKDNEGRTPLSFAAPENLESLTILLSRLDVDVNSRNNNGRTPFSYAVGVEMDEYASKAARKFLASERVDTNIQDSLGHTALVYATERKNYRAIKCWLSEKCDRVQDAASIQEPSDIAQGVALFLAVSPSMRFIHGNNLPLIRLLLKNCGNLVNWKDRHGQTPLMQSLRSFEFGSESFEYLLRHPCIDIKLKDENGKSALHYATEKGNRAAMTSLLIHASDGFNVACKDVSGKTPLMYAVSRLEPDVSLLDAILERPEVEINDSDNEGRTVFSHAMGSPHIHWCDTMDVVLKPTDLHSYGRSSKALTTLSHDMRSPYVYRCDAVLRLLRMVNINVNEPDNKGRTPLAHAAGIPDHVRLLLEDSRVVPDTIDREGKTPIFYAAEQGDHDSVSMLVQRNLDPCLTDFHGRSPLFYATWHPAKAQQETLELLLQQPGSDVNAQDREGLVPLAYAVQGWDGRFHDERTFLTLIKHPKINLNAVDDNGRTPISLWAGVIPKNELFFEEFRTIGRVLLSDPRTKVAISDKNGRTPIHHAAMSSNVQAVKVFLEQESIDLEMKDRDGWTALTWVQHILKGLENDNADAVPECQKETLREIHQLLAARTP